MKTNTLKGVKLIFISGILNNLLSIAHFVFLYLTYTEYASVITPEAKHVLSDFLLFSTGMGFSVLFIGILSLYCYTGLKHKEKWAINICLGASLYLFIAAITILVIMGFDQPIAYVHILNGLMIGIPLLINRNLF